MAALQQWRAAAGAPPPRVRPRRAPRCTARAAVAAAAAPLCHACAQRREQLGPAAAWRVRPACSAPARRLGRAAAATDAAAAAVAAPIDAAAAADAFRAWYAARATDMPADLTPRPVEGPAGGFCMVTAGPVGAGAPLLAVPRSLLMTADTARSSPACGDLIRKAELDDWQALILHLLCEAADPGSAWAPYLDLLRAADMSRHPLLWGDEERGWLAGSPMARVLDARRLQVEGDAAALVEAGANELLAAAGVPGGAPLVTPASVGWAAAVLLSRAFSLYLAPEPDHAIMPMDDFGSWDRSGEDVLALVPWADMLQHSSECGDASVLRYDVETDTAFLCAHRAYGPGDEVFDSYGPGLSPGDLLADYGFVDPANTNYRYDAPPADIASPRGPRNASLLAALDALQGEGSLLALGPGGPDTTGLTVLRASLAGEAELVRAGWRTRAGPRDIGLAARTLGRLSRPESRDTEAALLAALARYCAAALAGYPSSLVQDEAEAAAAEDALARGAAGAGEARRLGLRLQALRALASEKRALAGTAAAVASWQARLQDGRPLPEVYAGLEGGGDDGWDE
ncbi:MAG: hypothetical protein J3K34DRAFT_460119 [Monoraphidium minutum]|nr:MAG: hypothetical protein J3K34DRAFT_460119 [Monoraphidium minutum]